MPICSTAAKKRDSEALVDDHHQAGVITEAALDDALHGDLLVAEDLGDLREHAGPVGHLEVQVEGRGRRR